MTSLIDLYYTFLVIYRFYRKPNRADWFKGIPESYVHGLAQEENPYNYEELFMIHRQAKELYRASINRQ